MWDIRTCFTYAQSAGTDADFFQTVTGAEEVSTNVIDLDAAGLDVGGSNPPWWILRVGTVFATCVSMEFKLISATAADLTTGVKVLISVRVLAAELTAGALIVNQPLGHFSYQRYLGLEITPFTNATTGTIISGLMTGPDPAVTDIDIVEAAS